MCFKAKQWKHFYEFSHFLVSNGNIPGESQERFTPLESCETKACDQYSKLEF